MGADASLDRLIGRVIWVGVRGAEPGDGVLDAELDRCAEAHAGGVILFDVDVPERDRLRSQGLEEESARANAPRNIHSPEQCRALVQHIKDRLGEHVIVSVDQEGGFVSRLAPRRGFAEVPAPRDYARLDEAERARAARSLADTLAQAGVDLNLSPCVDVAVNPEGPGHTALGRSFGRDPQRVTQCAREQIEAMHREGVAACLKHFPGHGSARGDTHFGLVDITDTWERDDELRPYRELFTPRQGPVALMISHLVHRGLDPELPCSLSPAVIEALAREQLGFDGIVLTDSLDMRSIADRFDAGRATVLALAAGADAALEANNLTEVVPCPAPRMHHAIKQAIESGELDFAQLERSAARLDTFNGELRSIRPRETTLDA